MNFSELMVGIDVGGTFTDFVVREADGLRVLKVPSTPHDQSAAILDGLHQLGIAGAVPIVHGSTVATNALLERRGARTALLTTQGFADVLEIGRQNRIGLYSLRPTRPEPLMPREWRFEVRERLDCDGKVLCALDEEGVRDIARKLRAENIESVAVVFLFSFLNAAHEQRAAAILREELPQIVVSISSEILPEYREFERTSTTVINAYVRPPVEKYLARLSAGLERGFPASRLSIMQSNGGAIGSRAASEQAARLVLSGPAGGVVGAFAIARQAMQTSTPHILTFDMGGTSTDVALLPGSIESSSESSIAGLPMRLPVIDIHTVGAGGGSVARVDEAGILHVGPQSAGAVPGPACYNRGGTQPTVSDANVLLGRLDARYFLGGAGDVQLNAQAARAAMLPIASALDTTPEATALGILMIANATMERALRRVSIERGHDPRDFVLLPFGGAGPLHACDLAQALGITQVMIPRAPGALSALGMTVADAVRDESRALLGPLEKWIREPNVMQQAMHEMRAVIADALQTFADGKTMSKVLWEVSLDLRYFGQSYELSIPLEADLDSATQSTLGVALSSAADAFHHAHQARYGYARPDAAIESTVLRLRGRVLTQTFADDREEERENRPVATETRPVWFDESGPQLTSCFSREQLKPGDRFEGPAIVFQFDCTTLIAPLWQARVDGWNNLWLEYTATL